MVMVSTFYGKCNYESKNLWFSHLAFKIVLFYNTSLVISNAEIWLHSNQFLLFLAYVCICWWLTWYLVSFVFFPMVLLLGKVNMVIWQILQLLLSKIYCKVSILKHFPPILTKYWKAFYNRKAIPLKHLPFSCVFFNSRSDQGIKFHPENEQQLINLTE